MQTLTIKIKDKQNLEFLLELLSKFAFVEEVKSGSKRKDLPITLPTGKPSITDFAGIWEHKYKTLEKSMEQKYMIPIFFNY